MHPFHIMLMVFAAAALVGVVFVVGWERRQFMLRGLGSSWLKVRLSTIPTALLSAALIVIPTRSTSGMEGLAVFYVLLMTSAPLLWFSSHWAIGRLARPPLSFCDSARIASSPIIYALALAMAAHQLQALAWSLLRQMGIE